MLSAFHSEALLDAVLPAVVDHAWTFIYGAALRPSNDAYPNVRGTDQLVENKTITEKQSEWNMFVALLCSLLWKVIEVFWSWAF